MTLVFVSQRVDAHPQRGERRDALDQRLCRFLRACGCLPMPVPNDADLAALLWAAQRPSGLVLSGGNDLAQLGGDAPERDAAEAAMLALAERNGTPVLGICRGMQHLAARSGGQLGKAPGHAGTRHPIFGKIQRTVDSHHDWVVEALGQGWEALATAEDGTIEAARRTDAPQAGLMWHPERRLPFDPEDIALVRQVLGLGGEVF